MALREIFQKFPNDISADEIEAVYHESLTSDYALRIFELMKNKDTCLVSAIALKDYMKNGWKIVRLGVQFSKITLSHLEHIKSNIFDILHTTEQPAAQQQIIDIIVIIARIESPQNWPLFIEMIKENTVVSNRRNFHLEIASSLCHRYKSMTASDDLYREIKFIDDELSTHITSVFKAATQELSNTPQPDTFITLRYCVNFFRYMNAQDLTAQMENELIQWFNGFGKILSFDQQAVVGDQRAEKSLYSLWKAVVRAHTLFANKYEEQLEPYIKPFMDYILQTDKRKLKKFAPDALIFFATAAKRDRFRILFSSKDVLNGIFNKVILPNITFASSKLLENSDDYIQYDMCVDINTPRQAANECINVLAQNHVNFCHIVAQHVEALLNSENQRNSLRIALFLVPLVQSIDIDAFCAQQVIPVLKNGPDLAVRCDAIKLVLKFGSLLNENLLSSCLKRLQCYRNNSSINSVVAKYASWTLNKWTGKVRSSTTNMERNNTLQNVKSVLKSVLNSKLKPSPYLSERTFSDLNIDRNICTALAAMGIEQASHMQEQFIPKLLQSPFFNLQLMAHHGSGKSLAYLLPVLQRIDFSKNVTQALCVVISYEAAVQTVNWLARMAMYLENPNRIGAAIQRTGYNIRSDCHIIVGTAKEIVAFRLLNVYDLNNLAVAVIDDSDLVVTLPLLKTNIIDPLPKACQKIYVSSFDWRPKKEFNAQIQTRLTFTDSIYPQNITNYFVKLQNPSDKLGIIRTVCSEVSLSSRAQAIIFFTKREDAEMCFSVFKGKGHSCALHIGCADVQQRLKTMQNFVDGATKVLFTTDFMGRAVDFPNVRVVVNFDLPLGGDGEPSYKLYMQRVGRTGRFGRDGIVLNTLSELKSFCTYKKLSESLKFKLQRINL